MVDAQQSPFSAPEAVDQDVSAANQRGHGRAVLRLERDTALIGVEHGKPCSFASAISEIDTGRALPQRVAARWFCADDLGTEIDKKAGCVRSAGQGAEFEHPQTGEGFLTGNAAHRLNSSWRNNLRRDRESDGWPRSA